MSSALPDSAGRGRNRLLQVEAEETVRERLPETL
jgi:hypothetical protein